MSRSLVNPLGQAELVVADHIEVTLKKRRGVLARSILQAVSRRQSASAIRI